MKQFSNAYAQINTSGMDINVWSSLIVAVGKYGTRQPSNVTVLHLSTGMGHSVFSVLTEKFGLIS